MREAECDRKSDEDRQDDPDDAENEKKNAGGVVHYDGMRWAEMDSGSDVDLWGVWGSDPNDVWAVGGNIPDGPPIILHYDGMAWSSVEVPMLDRSSTALLKVWGTSSANVFAVGQLGVIVKYDGNSWQQVPSGTGEDLISLWGSGPSQIVAVGGRNNGVVARYDGSGWTSQSIAPFVGLNECLWNRRVRRLRWGCWARRGWSIPADSR